MLVLLSLEKVLKVFEFGFSFFLLRNWLYSLYSLSLRLHIGKLSVWVLFSTSCNFNAIVLVKCYFHILFYFPYYSEVHKEEIKSIYEGLDPKDELEQHLILERMPRKTQSHFLYGGEVWLAVHYGKSGIRCQIYFSFIF